MRAIIIDDELAGITALKLLIEKHTENINVVATTHEPEKGITLIENYQPDIVFLDINMPTMNGFELLDNLSFRDFKLVFTTAHEQYAIEAIKNKAYDYLLKPIDVDDLKKCIEDICNSVKAKSNSTNVPSNIEVVTKGGIVFIKITDIIKLVADGSYTEIHLKNGTTCLASKGIKEFEAKLPSNFFLRCHTSYIINLKEVVELVSKKEGIYAKMTDNSLVEIARKNKPLFLDMLRKI